jgi:hypothetical protein
MKMLGGGGGRGDDFDSGGADSTSGAGRGSAKSGKDPFADSPEFSDVPVDDDIPF